jgi:hypothetical protein
MTLADVILDATAMHSEPGRLLERGTPARKILTTVIELRMAGTRASVRNVIEASGLREGTVRGARSKTPGLREAMDSDFPPEEFHRPGLDAEVASMRRWWLAHGDDAWSDAAGCTETHKVFHSAADAGMTDEPDPYADVDVLTLIPAREKFANLWGELAGPYVETICMAQMTATDPPAWAA